jgi:hypothetical protein
MYLVHCASQVCMFFSTYHWTSQSSGSTLQTGTRRRLTCCVGSNASRIIASGITQLQNNQSSQTKATCAKERIYFSSFVEGNSTATWTGITRYTGFLEDRAIKDRHAAGKKIFMLTVSISALEATQPWVKWIPGALVANGDGRTVQLCI